jgi:peptide deformylase
MRAASRFDILTYGDPVLRAPATNVPAVTAEIRRLAEDMLAAMYAHNGAGLAAQQIGRMERLCVIDVSQREAADKTPAAAPPENPDIPMPLVLINPRIASLEGQQRGSEGCLSFPEIFVDVTRAAEVTVTYTDLRGHERTLTGRGLLARAIQHELDHLNGVLLVDHMSAVQKVALAGKLRRLKKQTLEALG